MGTSAPMMDLVPIHQVTTPLVGRGSDLEQLVELVGLVAPQGAAGGAVLLSGDAGVGKTRLLAELRTHAEAAGWRTLAGHCLDFGDSALPYLPFTEILGRLAQDAPDLVAAVSEGRPAVAHLLPGQRLLRTHGPDGDDVERSDLFETVHAAFERIAQTGPLLVVLEDLHWADQSTRDLLGFLFQRGFAAPVRLVASYRSDDLHRRHPLRTAVAQWSRFPGVHRLALGPLDDSAVRSLATSLHTGSLSEADLRRIVARAEGNAFFAEELVVASEVGSRSLPEDLASLLLVRVDQLDEDARQIVRAASCAGRQVEHDMLAAVVGLDADRLERGLRQAVETNVLVPSGAQYAFRHALLGEAVYDDLLPGERVRLHASYVEALCCHVAPGTAAELARHARAAHDVPNALRASIEAGDDAMAVGGPDDAARHYEVALELAGNAIRSDAPEHGVDVTSLTVRASEALIAAGDPFRAVQLVTDQLAQLPDDADPERRVGLLIALATASLMMDSDVDALDMTTEALGLVGSEPTRLRARLLSVHAHANAVRQRVDEAARWATEAVTLAREVGLPKVALNAATTLAKIEERKDDPETSRRAFEAIVAQARSDGDLAAELRGLHHLGALHFEHGRLEQAREAYEAACRKAADAGRPWAPYGFQARIFAGLVAYVDGRWDEALRITDVGGEPAPGLAEAALSAVALAVRAGRGEVAALEQLPTSRRWWDRDGFLPVLSGAPAIDLYGDSGDLDAALEVHDEVVAAVTRLWQVTSFGAQIRLGALVVGHLAGAAATRSAAERPGLVRRGDALLEVARHLLTEVYDGRAMGPEGRAWLARIEAEHLRLRWIAGVDSPAEEDLVAAWVLAVEEFAAFGHVFELARSRTRLAAVLRSLGRTAEARQHSDPAREVAHRLGARPLLDELSAAGSTAARAAPEPGTLTPREHEILTLVAQGRSNGEIARQLFISAKTVSVHVSNILAKLGASGRTEASALARTRGLLG